MLRYVLMMFRFEHHYHIMLHAVSLHVFLWKHKTNDFLSRVEKTYLHGLLCYPLRIQGNPEKTEKWYLTFLYVPIFLKFIHSMLGTFIMDILMY